MHSQHSDSKRKRRHARSQWPDPSWPDLDSLLSWPDVPLDWSDQDVESLLRWPDDLLKALDAPLGWSDGWPDLDSLSWPEWR